MAGIAGGAVLDYFEGVEGREERGWGVCLAPQEGKEVEIPLFVEREAEVFELGGAGEDEFEGVQGVGGVVLVHPVRKDDREVELADGVPDELFVNG